MEAKRIFVFLLCGVFALLGISGCGKKQEQKGGGGAPQLEAKKVRVARVEQLAVEETVYATGTLGAQDRATMSAKVPGRVEAILVDLGSAVKEGDLLARIERHDYELRVRQADAALAQARARLGLSLGGEEDKVEPEKASIVKEARAVLSEALKNRDRVKNLRAEGVVPDADVETAEAAYQVAVNRYDEAIHEAKNRMATLAMRQAELGLAQQQLKETEIRAPFAGMVEQRQTSPGEFMNVGAPLLTVVRVDPIRLRLEVSEKDAPRVRIGQVVHMQVEGSERQHDGKISRISPVITADNRMLQAEADVANAEGLLRPGSFVKANVVVNDKAPGLFVPESAVQTFAGIQKIFLVGSGKAIEKEVRVGRERDGFVEAEGEFKDGDVVVIDPGNLRNGQPVEVTTNES
ncbi:MAG TPA: efflux RND transporter periplasmic adaptor subunit [Verrucomicrobiae bacterium]